MELTKEEIDGIQIDYIGISPIPMLNTDLEVDGKYPPVVEAFRQRFLWLIASSLLPLITGMKHSAVFVGYKVFWISFLYIFCNLYHDIHATPSIMFKGVTMNW
ncbi:hypothetical protein PVK06_046827 [Gossypium arboreum]|nr:hypothetical protein PVK06_046827 [Gossypium arboreum]